MKTTLPLPLFAIAGYAARMHAALGPGQRAISPLGAWLVLALVAPVTRGTNRQEIERVLGMDAEDAAAFARELIETPHPSVATAFGVWNHEAVRTAEVDAWLATLPAAVDHGPISDSLHAWVRGATRGKIPLLPVVLDDRAALLLVSVLAIDGMWRDPFALAPASELGDGPWASQVSQVLTSNDKFGRQLRRTKSAGLVATHVRESRNSFIVTAVVADPSVPPERVIAAAHEVAADAAEIPSLFDLPIGEGHSWTITETEVPTADADSRTQSGRVFLPAWKEELSTLDLLAHPEFGYGAARDALIAIFPPHPEGYEARAAQATTATYDRHGFRATSVSSLLMYIGAAMPRPKTDHGLHRHVDARFARPFAVVAVADAPGGMTHPWRGVPMFSAWVTRPMEPDTRSPETE